MTQLHKEIIHTISYFGFFEYAPKFDEIHTFLPKKVSIHGLQKELDELVKKKIILRLNIDDENMSRYTLGEYSMRVRSPKLQVRSRNSIFKINQAQKYIRILSWFPQIRLIGLSGSVAMQNAEETDDTDLFIITSAGRMWTARFISLMLAHLMGVRRKRNDQYVENKICLNLFFDESDLPLPKRKQTEYGAHEVLQMKPIVDKFGTYKRFLDANKWVLEIFPNAQVKSATKPQKHWILLPIAIGIRMTSDFVEKILKQFQLFFIRKHLTTEIVTDTQLWFFPEDFEKKLRKDL